MKEEIANRLEMEKKHHLQNVCFLFIYFYFCGNRVILFLSGRDSSIFLLLPWTSRSTETSVSSKFHGITLRKLEFSDLICVLDNIDSYVCKSLQFLNFIAFL